MTHWPWNALVALGALLAANIVLIWFVHRAETRRHRMKIWRSDEIRLGIEQLEDYLDSEG